ncbi:MAG: hypothetical protein J6B29_00935 [Clostridia bacterium]|nr:hypothetical protein [Clostridia bacterium]
MKNLFGINIGNENEDELSKELKSLVVRELDPYLTARQEEAMSKLDELESKWSMPSWLSVLRIALIGLGTALLVTVIRALLDMGADAFASPFTIVFAVLGAVLVGVGIALFVIEGKRRRGVESSDEYKTFVSYLNSLDASVEQSLKIPTDRASVDVLYLPYEEKDGKIKSNRHFKYLNIERSLFIEDGKLCIADGGYVYGISLDSIKALVLRDERISFAQWNKEEMFDKGEYKEYHISVDNTGVLHMKGLISLQLIKDGEELEITLPLYEKEAIESLTGLTVE